jgi:hypothetical protein
VCDMCQIPHPRQSLIVLCRICFFDTAFYVPGSGDANTRFSECVTSLGDVGKPISYFLQAQTSCNHTLLTCV